MTALLIAWLITLPGMLAAGYTLGRRSARTRIPKHEHAFEQWIDTTITVVNGLGQRLYQAPAQDRVCIGCGYRERRRVEGRR